MARNISIAVLLLVTAGISTAQVQRLTAVRTAESITINGELSEGSWQRTGFVGLVQQEPEQWAPPSQRSEVWVAYDDESLYFAARYSDTSPDSIMARLVRRDFIWGDPSDGCVLYLDTYHDRRNGYFFYVSAAGALADGLIENDLKQPNDLTWDAVWDGAARIDACGWCIEMRIPFSQLRFTGGENQIWGINVERFISRRAETDMIVFTPRNESGFTSRFPELIGITGISPASQVEAMPYFTGKAEYIGSDPSNPFNSGERYLPGAGLDFRAGLGRSLTLNATVNPDFGQVEVDPAVVNLTDVESTFEERRPFFTEGANIYTFGRGGISSNTSFSWAAPSIFYSRRIGRTPQGSLPPADYADMPNATHILTAGKLSGTLPGGWRLGTVHAFTRREHARIAVGETRTRIELEPASYYGVLRTQKDFDAGRQGIGLLTTYVRRMFDDPALRGAVNGSAFVAGIDGWTALDSDATYVVSGWGAGSHVTGDVPRLIDLQRSPGHYFQRPDAPHVGVDSGRTSLGGYAGRLQLNKNRGPIALNAAVGFLSPGFEVNDLGYGSFSDLVNAHLLTGYRWNTPTPWYLSAGVNASGFVNYDFGGHRTGQGYSLGGYLVHPSLYGGNFSITLNPQSLNARRTRGGPLTVNPASTSANLVLFTDNRLWYVLTLAGFLRTGKELDSRSLSATLELKVTPTLTVSAGPQLSRDRYDAQWVSGADDPSATGTYGRRYIFAHLDQTTLAADLRADWIISPTLSFQVYLQPLVSSGSYRDFKFLARSSSYDFTVYGDNGSTVEVRKGSGGFAEGYLLDADGTGSSPAASIGNPDFNIVSLRGNAVFRWEYLPGSTLYVVWTQNRSDLQPVGGFRFGQSVAHLFEVRPDNIFMIKLSYWWGV